MLQFTNSQLLTLKKIALSSVMLISIALLLWAIWFSAKAKMINGVHTLTAMDIPVVEIPIRQYPNAEPISYICQPYTDTVFLIYPPSSMVALTRSNGYVVTCAEARELKILK